MKANHHLRPRGGLGAGLAPNGVAEISLRRARADPSRRLLLRARYRDGMHNVTGEADAHPTGIEAIRHRCCRKRLPSSRQVPWPWSRAVRGSRSVERQWRVRRNVQPERRRGGIPGRCRQVPLRRPPHGRVDTTRIRRGNRGSQQSVNICSRHPDPDPVDTLANDDRTACPFGVEGTNHHQRYSGNNASEDPDRVHRPPRPNRSTVSETGV